MDLAGADLQNVGLFDAQIVTGRVYSAGHVSAVGCRTTDALSGVAQKTTLRVTITGSNGVGVFTATGAGGLN